MHDLRQYARKLAPTRRDLLLTAVAIVGGSAICLSLQALTGRAAPLLSFFPFFVLAALYGRRIAGLLSVALATALLATFWVGANGWLVGLKVDATSLELFALLGTLIVVGFSRSAEAVRALKQTEQRFRVALQGSNITVWTCDEQLRYTWLYNLPPQVDPASILGKRVGSANPDDQYPEFIAAVERVWKSGRAESLPITWTHKGERRHYFMNLDLLRDPSGAVRGLVGASMDVTSLHAAQSEAAQARTQLQAIADVMASGVALCGRDLRYRWASRGYLDWVGKPGEQVIGQSMQEVLGQVLFEIKRPYVERVLAGESVTFDHEQAAADGAQRWVHIAYTPWRDATGRIDGWVGVITDITDRRKVEQALLEADRRKDEFLATLAHELRNPMAAIRYSVRLLRAEAPPAVLERARGAIERQSHQMARLLDGLLDVSRVTRDVIQLEPRELDLRMLVQDAIEAARPEIDAARHRLVLSVPPQELWVRGDPVRLLQVMGNLLSNAARYTPPGGEVRVTLEPQADEVHVRVRDNGAGLSPDMLPKVFDLFAQVHRDLKATASGLGIGLAIAKRLTELHGGRIEVRSEGLDRGAEFTVSLPRILPAEQRTQTADKVIALFQGEARVLLVDDNRDAADNLAVLLRSHGLRVAVAYEGRQALELAESLRPTVVLLDIGLPDMSGLEVARSLRRSVSGREVLIVAVTGWGQPADRAASREAGIDVHLVKPIDPDELLHLIQAEPEVRRRRCEP